MSILIFIVFMLTFLLICSLAFLECMLYSLVYRCYSTQYLDEYLHFCCFYSSILADIFVDLSQRYITSSSLRDVMQHIIQTSIFIFIVYICISADIFFSLLMLIFRNCFILLLSFLLFSLFIKNFTFQQNCRTEC